MCQSCLTEYDSQTCAFCGSDACLEEILPHDARIRQQAFPAAGVAAVGTPIKVGDDFDTLKRKLLPFEAYVDTSGEEEGSRSGMRQINDLLRESESGDELQASEEAPPLADDERLEEKTEVARREGTGDVTAEGEVSAKEEKPLGLDVGPLGMSRAMPIEIESPR